MKNYYSKKKIIQISKMKENLFFFHNLNEFSKIFY